MALDKKFYEEIYEKENMWMDIIDSGLINVYYLEEIRKFYIDKQDILNCELQLSQEDDIKKVSVYLNNIIVKLNYLINENKNGYVINIPDLKKFFLINMFNKKNGDNHTKTNKTIFEGTKKLYELRNKITNQDNEDYTDDDFYYENKKVA